jgi:hypothetical protein
VQLEPHAWVLGTEAAHQVRYQPGAERMLEGENDGPVGRVKQLVQRGQPIVEAVQHRVDVPLEHGARVRHPQRAARPVQQRHADLRLQPGQRSRHPRLRDRLHLAHLGHGRPVGDLLKPAQCVGIHIYDNNSCVGCKHVIGRIRNPGRH